MTTRVKPGAGRAPEAALPRPTYLVKQLQEALLRRLDSITSRFDLTTHQYTTLSVLAKYPGISSAQLARLTFVSAQAANEMVGTLEGKGFLRRSVDHSNRRRLEVKLTPAATRTLSKCDAQVDALERELFRDVEPEDKAHFHRMLDICLSAITNAR